MADGLVLKNDGTGKNKLYWRAGEVLNDLGAIDEKLITQSGKKYLCPMIDFAIVTIEGEVDIDG